MCLLLYTTIKVISTQHWLLGLAGKCCKIRGGATTAEAWATSCGMYKRQRKRTDKVKERLEEKK
jgi:hypothetical protein